MFSVIIAVLVLLVVLVGPRFLPYTSGREGTRLPLVPTFAVRIVQGLLCLWAFYLVVSTSIVMVPSNKVGVVTRNYAASSLPQGHIIATNGETGIQAKTIPPGSFFVSFLYNIYNTVDYQPIVQIPQGYYGRVVARDGTNLRSDQIVADAWPNEKMLDAEVFLTQGGQKGLQLSVLKPGVYPINTALFTVVVGGGGKELVWDQRGDREEKGALDTSLTKVPAGFVGVVRSSVQDVGIDCKVETTKADNYSSDALAAEVVPQGCRGVWKSALAPNDYYLNRDVYDVVLVDTKVQALRFEGGFTKRFIDLKLDDKGQFVQNEHSEQRAVPPEAVDDAVTSKAEGWEIPQELRVVVQISPERAPLIVAAVGGLKEVEQRIMIPSIRSHVRNVLGGNVTFKTAEGKEEIRQTRVLDTIENRPLLEDEILHRIQVDGRRAGVDVKEVRFGESAIPPELLLARQRQQLAEQLKKAYEQEQVAQTQRQQTEQARATADQQASLVGQQIEQQKSELRVKTRQNDGLAEQKFLEAQAAGAKAQVAVLGEDKVVMLQALDKVLAKPEIWNVVGQLKLPTYVNLGSGFDPNLAAGILKSVTGDHNK